MDAETLAKAMSCPLSRAADYQADFNRALVQAKCTTVDRVAMFCAQVGHESVGLKYMEEIASGAAYEGRADLGNTQRGDGVRFKGRGPIQLTGRGNYARFGAWCKAQGITKDADYFVNHPEVVATSAYGFLAASWYWTVARNMNGYADAQDILGATKAVNGGTNGLSDRTMRWRLCLELGTKLLPKTVAAGGGTVAAQTGGGEGVEIMERVHVVPPNAGQNTVRLFLSGSQGAAVIVRPLLNGQGVSKPMWVGNIFAWGSNRTGVGGNPKSDPKYDDRLTSHRRFALPGAVWADLEYSAAEPFDIDIVG
jgi:predicted chitinase